MGKAKLVLIIVLMIILLASCKEQNPAEPTAQDYFPIKVGSSIRYSYSSSATDYVNTYQSDGDAFWNITYARDVEGTTIYSANETKRVMTSINGGTATYSESTKSFQITQDKTGLVTIQGLMNLSFNRYKSDDKSWGTTKSLSSGEGYAEFKMGVGIVKIVVIGFRSSETYELR